MEPLDPLGSPHPVIPLEQAGTLVLVSQLAEDRLVGEALHHRHVYGGQQHHVGAGQVPGQQVQT